MPQTVYCSTPSRICLFGEHQDYLGLEVIASAVDLRFHARARRRNDRLLHIRIRDEAEGVLNAPDDAPLQEFAIDLDEPLVYDGGRDYFKSAVNVLRRAGAEFDTGADVTLTSDIPIGKGMCSSTTMVVVFVRALAQLYGCAGAEDPMRTAHLAWEAEVEEFGEPGGKMDHYASALGGLLHIDFSTGDARPERLDARIPGCFILFDSLERKDTLGVLKKSKFPTLEAIDQLRPCGVRSVRDFYLDPGKEDLLSQLDETHREKLRANINNYRIQREAYEMLRSGRFDEERFGALLRRHYENLSGGLHISTGRIDQILRTAYDSGALGGKFNGTGGGGCCFVYARREDAGRVLEAVEALGYPGRILLPDSGVRAERAPAARQPIIERKG